MQVALFFAYVDADFHGMVGPHPLAYLKLDTVIEPVPVDTFKRRLGWFSIFF